MRLSSRNRWAIGAAIVYAAILALLWLKLRPTYDLTYFLPAPSTEQERVFFERLGEGAGARLVFIELDAGPDAPPEVDAGEFALQLAARLEESGRFARIETGQRELDLGAIPETIRARRYLLADVDWSESGLRTALEERLRELATLASPGYSELVASDPSAASLRTLRQLAPGGEARQPHWVEGTRRAFLLAETRALPFELDAQRAVLETIRAAVRATAIQIGGAAAAMRVEPYGFGIYSAGIQDVVQRESQLLSLAAAALVLVVIAFAYRSARLTLLAFVPLASALLAGLAASALMFGGVHGITIAFGATLLGVVDDYPMHLFSHARHLDPGASIRRLFGTLLASAATAICAYAALLFSGSRGLVQLGVFSLAGILGALLATTLLLPRLMGPAEPDAADPLVPGDAQALVLSMRIWLPLLAIAALALAVSGGLRWNDDLGALTPLPPQVLARDAAMRERFGAPDVRHLVSLGPGPREAVLAETEALARALPEARAQRLVESWTDASMLLPSLTTQQQRLARIPEPAELARRLAAAQRGLPLRAGVFGPFLADAALARSSAPVVAADYRDSPLGLFLANHLAGEGDRVRSYVHLGGLRSPADFEAWLRGANANARLVDLKAASQTLVRGYRERLLSILAGALVLIAAIVALATRDARRFLWCTGTVAAVVLATLVAVAALHGSVTIFHIVSLVLVAGLGVDYCLFYSRPDVTRTEFADTRHAILACAASTAGAFALLGGSSIPLLAAIGTTVGIGTSLMFLAARLGCRPV